MSAALPRSMSLEHLNCLIVDADIEARLSLMGVLETLEPTSQIKAADNCTDGLEQIISGGIDAVFIDPLSIGIDDAADFIFTIRTTHPSIVFVLYSDMAEAESHRGQLYRGERHRFSHYFKLDKLTPVAAFKREVGAVLGLCRGYIAWHAVRTELRADASSSDDLSHSRGVNQALDTTELVLLNGRGAKDTVFLSCRFSETEYIEGLTRLLSKNGFKVIMGDRTIGYVSQSVLERIRGAEYFLALMTRKHELVTGEFVTSSWVLEEKGAALALGKQIVLLVEDGLSDLGGLQGDWQRIHFGRKGFLMAALQAVEQLLSYSGRES
jgi:hypothetical protein